MITYKIDDDVPLPPGREGRMGPVGATIKALNVGGSFFAPGKTPNTVGGSLNPYKAQGKSFLTSTRTEPHPDTLEPVKGVRIWRTA